MNVKFFRIKEMDENVHSFSFIDDEKVILQQAKESEERWSQGKPNGEMDGLMVSIKDLLNVKGFTIILETHSHRLSNYLWIQKIHPCSSL
jgi:Asp-tRNA(Asn)/Glu-tRNA(Gln) amidotransferase A subunit family amidase